MWLLLCVGFLLLFFVFLFLFLFFFGGWEGVNRIHYSLPKEMNIFEYVDINLSQRSWWKSNQHFYPFLSKVAKHLLCIIPATSVPNERSFSTVGELVTAHRVSLLAEHVDMVVFLKNM